jgi:DNA-binding MarR family transcriptional regulator
LQTQQVFPLKDPHQNLIFLTNRVGRQLSRLLLDRMEFEKFLPQSTHMGLLADLMTNDGMRQQDLAISTIKDKGTVARALKQLEAVGIINREVDPEDRRQKRIYLTEKAHRMWAYAHDHANYAICCAKKDIPPEELAVCTSVLNKIYHNLHQQLSIPQSINHE